jgi:hypothetical protein
MATTVKIFEGGYALLSVAKGEVFFANHLVPEGTERFAKVESLEGGSKKIIAEIDILAVVEGLHSSIKGAKHVRFVREKKEGKGLKFVGFKPFPKMRAALRHAGVEPLHAPGGFENFVIYDDEVAVPDFSMSGTKGWIVPRKEIAGYLKGLPPLENFDSGEIKSLWGETVGDFCTPDEAGCRVTEWDPTDEEPLSWYDRGRDCRMTGNRQIARIDYDAGSHRIVKILHQNTGQELEHWPVRLRPRVVGVTVGKRFPTWLP